MIGIKRFTGFVLFAFLVVATAMVMAGCSSGPLGQTPDKIKEAFLEEAIMQKGVVDNAYVSESDYELKEFNVENIEEVTKGVEVDADFSATIENANFVSDMSGVVKYSRVEDTDGGYYLFDITSYETTPKKGIDFDESRNLENVDAVLSEDSKTCSVDVDKNYEFWFVDSKINTVYSYEFTGKKWEFKGADKQHTAIYKDIDGKYAANTGDLTDLANFEISNLDAEKGTFEIIYTAKETAIPVGISRTRVYPEVSATLTAAINSEDRGNEILDDGYSYRFEATGTTSQGADKPVTIEGYFLANSNGELAIEITKFSQTIDYASEYSGNTQTQNASMGTGTLYKQ